MAVAINIEIFLAMRLMFHGKIFLQKKTLGKLHDENNLEHGR